MSSPAGVPWHVSLRGRILWLLWRPAWRSYWVRYWESQGIAEKQQMEWASELETDGPD